MGESSPRLTVDLVLFSLVEEQLCTLMVKRKDPPFENCWALPATEVDTHRDSSLEQTAKRNVKRLTGFETPYLEQVQTIGNDFRDPRGWSITVVYYGLVSSGQMLHANQSNWEAMKWMSVSDALSGELSFDHQHLIESCLQRLQNKSLYTSLPIFLLTEEFTLTELQKTYELILGFKMEKKSFRRRLLDAGFLEETGQSRHANHRPALLYRLSQRQPYFFARIIEGVRDSKNIE